MPIVNNDELETLEFPGLRHQIVNTSTEEMRLVAALGMAPVRVKTADGAALPVPWEAPAK